jgi:hypothetical protein
MTYSRTHKRFSELLKKPDALTNPEKYLGPNYQDVLNFWIYLDTLSYLEKREIVERYYALNDYVRHYAIDAAWNATKVVVGEDFRRAAWRAACDVTGCNVFCDATYEIIGHHKLEEPSKPLLSYSLSSPHLSDCLGEEIVNFLASGGILSIINEIRDSYSLNRSENIRRAMALFFIAKKEQQKGNRLAIIDSDGNIIADIHSF